MIGDWSEPRGSSGLSNSIDQHVGARVRARRLMAGISQTKLAEGLEISSKQVRKYEKGVSQISAGRLLQIARVLRVPLPCFFDGGGGAVPDCAEPIRSSNPISFILTGDGLLLNRAFASIRDPVVRNKILLLAELLAGDADGGFPR